MARSGSGTRPAANEGAFADSGRGSRGPSGRICGRGPEALRSVSEGPFADQMQLFRSCEVDHIAGEVSLAGYAIKDAIWIYMKHRIIHRLEEWKGLGGEG